ncbi:MAG: hypothetical protein DMG40_12490 [Acidobacteria bacterium]|nr:MAG: hypothetical protein DMG40_12490 [Acidobacteriota bacterium]
MILQVWKSKLRTAFFPVWFLVLILTLLAEIPPALAQADFFDGPPNRPFGKRTGEIQGTVYLNRGAKPASQVFVNIRSLSAGTIETISTDFDGHFELREVPPGAYEVSAAEQGYGIASAITQVSFFPAEVTLCLSSSSAPPPSANAYTVSVRELKIPSKAQDEYQRGLERMAKNDFAGSLGHFKKAAAAYPDYYEAFYQIGVAELRLHHQMEAMEALQKAIDLSDGHYARAQFAYGLILCNQGKPKEGEDLIKRGLETDPDSPQGHLFLGIALLDQNRADEAEKSLREALLRKPDYPDVYLVLADVHAKRKDYQSQVRDLDNYLKLVPSSPGNAYVRGVRDTAKRLLSQSVPRN